MLSGDFTPQSIRANTPKPFGIEENVFKYHAACYYTHSAIEAISKLKDEANIRPEDISSISVGLQAPLLTVCDIVEPTTGLETKFSVRHLIAMALLDYDTTNPEVFSDAVTHDPQIRHLGKKVTAVPFDTANRMEARVQVTLVDQQMHEMVCDVSAPSTDLDHQERALLKKFVRWPDQDWGRWQSRPQLICLQRPQRVMFFMPLIRKERHCDKGPRLPHVD